jgi:hypothetical protein
MLQTLPAQKLSQTKVSPACLASVVPSIYIFVTNGKLCVAAQQRWAFSDRMEIIWKGDLNRFYDIGA